MLSWIRDKKKKLKPQARRMVNFYGELVATHESTSAVGAFRETLCAAS